MKAMQAAESVEESTLLPCDEIFWDVEVRYGRPVEVAVRNHQVLHLAQARICNPKKMKENERILLFIEIDSKKFVVGTLLSKTLIQQQLNVFCTEKFTLSHSLKDGEVNFFGMMLNRSNGGKAVTIPLIQVNNERHFTLYQNSDDSREEFDTDTDTDSEDNEWSLIQLNNPNRCWWCSRDFETKVGLDMHNKAFTDFHKQLYKYRTTKKTQM